MAFVNLPMLFHLFRFFVYGNLWVGLSVASMSALTLGFAGHPSLDYVLLCFCSTVAFYGFARYVETPKQYVGQMQSIASWTVRNRKLLLVIVLIHALAAFYFWLQLPSNIRWIYLAVSAFSSMYTVPTLFSRKSVRYLAGLKLIHIALVWMLVTVTIPLLLANAPWNTAWALAHLERFSFILALTIPFDIRDAKNDSTEMLTLPMWLGQSGARNVALTAITFVILLQFYPVFTGDHPRWGQVAVYLIGGYLIHRSSEKENDMYFSFWLEGLPLFLVLTHIIFF